MLDLVILRHGRAEPARGGMTDEERPLSAAGEGSFQLAARGMVRLLAPPVEIVASPYLRTRQTARILREALAEVEKDSRLAESDARLVPGAPADEAVHLVRERDGGEGAGTLILVSHMPLAGRLAGRLLGVRPLDLATGEACAIRLDGDHGRLAWKLPESAAAAIIEDGVHE